jgi:IS5 family transposase
MKSNIIVGVSAHKSNEHDSKTLELALTSAKQNRTKPIKEAICDRGYRGEKRVNGSIISIPNTKRKEDAKYQIELKHKKFRRRAAVESMITHLKPDYKLSRNYLKRFIGDEINLLLVATVWSLKKWMNDFLELIFMFRVVLIYVVQLQLKLNQKIKYVDLGLTLFRIVK